MKPTIVFFALFFVACGTKSTSETISNDTTQVILLDTTEVQSVDTVRAQNLSAEQPDVAEVKTEKKDPTIKTIRCKFLRFDEGECLHLIFDCGDYGSVETESLPKEQADVWNNLIAFSEEHGDAPYSNPKYVGKTFEIVHNMVQREVCKGPDATASELVLNLLSFKLIK